MPHGAKPPNGESLETQKSKRPLSDSPGRLGVPEGCISHSVSQSSRPPPFFFFLRFLPSFFSPFFSSPQCILCWPLLLLAPSALAAKAAGGSRRPAECVLGTCPAVFGVVSRALPPSPLGCSPERLPLRTVVLPRVTLGGGQGPRSSGRVWVCHLRQALGKVPWSLIHCISHGGPQGCGCAAPMNASPHMILYDMILYHIISYYIIFYFII